MWFDPNVLIFSSIIIAINFVCYQFIQYRDMLHCCCFFVHSSCAQVQLTGFFAYFFFLFHSFWRKTSNKLIWPMVYAYVYVCRCMYVDVKKNLACNQFGCGRVDASLSCFFGTILCCLQLSTLVCFCIIVIFSLALLNFVLHIRNILLTANENCKWQLIILI